MNTETKNLEQRARAALKAVETMGIGWVRESQAYGPYLVYGLEHGLFDQFAVDRVELIYKFSNLMK